MITRPLDLAAKLRPPPRSFDVWFFVNAGLIVLAFALFGSRFVLAPGLGVDFRLPEMPGARAMATETTHYITVNNAGLIIAPEGSITLKRLGEWLQEQAKDFDRLRAEGKNPPVPSLLVKASAGVSPAEQTQIVSLALAAKFRVQWAAEEPSSKPGASR